MCVCVCLSLTVSLFPKKKEKRKKISNEKKWCHQKRGAIKSMNNERQLTRKKRRRHNQWKKKERRKRNRCCNSKQGKKLGVSNRPGDPLNPANPLVSDPPPPDPMTPAVRRGFRTRSPDPTRVGCRFFLSKPMTLDPNRILSLSDELLQISNQFGWNLVQILRDLARSHRYPTKFGPDLDGPDQI